MNPRARNLIRSVRLDSRLTQTELAERLGTTQSAVARLEGPRSNPRLSTLTSALMAMGHRLELQARPVAPSGIDPTLIDAHLALDPLGRVRAHDAASRSARKLVESATLIPSGTDPRTSD